jgi:hypothetical protein
MKTTFKTLICTVLCTAASSAFAMGPPPPNASTTISFDNNPAQLVAGTDVTITTTTTPTGVDPAITPAVIAQGKVALQVATDGAGNLVPSAPGVTWVDLNLLGQQNPNLSGDASFPIDLDNISSLSTTGLINPTCPAFDQKLIGFRAHYITGGGMVHADSHFSPGASVTISCNPCGTSTDITIAVAQAGGPGSPPPGFTGCWTFTITVQNCTGQNLTGVKIQGGSNGWTDNTQTSATSTGGSNGSLNVKNNNRNSVITWTGDIAQGETVAIDVTVCGTIKAQTACGTVLTLNGPWSAAYTLGGVPMKTPYTGQLTIEVTCPPSP